MRKTLKVLLVLVAVFTITTASARSSECKELMKMTFDQIRAQMVRASIVHYEGLIGHCPCPYSFDMTLNTYCGANSAYKKNKKAVKCYPQDITYYDIANYKKQICSGS